MTRLPIRWRSAKMAAAEAIVLLSSSPPQRNINTTPPRQHAHMSSSPTLPSPSDLFSRKIYRPSSVSRGSSIPRNAALGFASASSLLRHSQAVDASAAHDDDKANNANTLVTESKAQELSKEAAESRTTAVKVAPKTRKESSETKRAKAPAKKVTLPKRKSIDRTESVDPIDSVRPVVEELTSKPRVRKTKETTQTTIKKTKVIKVGSANGSTKDLKCKRATKKSSEIDVTTAEPSVTEKEKTPPGRDKPLDLCIEEAIRRRTDWTPTKDTRDGFVGIEGSASASTSVDQGTPATSKRITHFGNLLGDYGYANITTSVKETSEFTRSSTGEALTKRRKVEVRQTPSLRCSQC